MKRAQKNIGLEWKLLAVDVFRFESLGKAIDELLSNQPDIVWTAPDPHIYTAATLRALLLKCVRKGVPIYGYSSALVRAGALFVFSVSPNGQGRQSAQLTERALHIAEASSNKAGKIQSLHLQPEPEILVNLLVAQKLQIKVSEQLLSHSTVIVHPE